MNQTGTARHCSTVPTLDLTAAHKKHSKKPKTKPLTTMKTTMSQGETVSHTPGPWKIINEPPSTRITPENNEFFSVATISGFNEANARLIAAAPDLLEACKLASESIDYLFALLVQKYTGFFPSKSGLPWTALQKVNAAIDRATNRECANVKTREREQTEQAEVTESSAQYFNTLLREAGCKSRWTVDTDETSNSVGTWFCKDTGGVTLEQQMREYTHKLLTLKSQFPDCGDL